MVNKRLWLAIDPESPGHSTDRVMPKYDILAPRDLDSWEIIQVCGVEGNSPAQRVANISSDLWEATIQLMGSHVVLVGSLVSSDQLVAAILILLKCLRPVANGRCRA